MGCSAIDDSVSLGEPPLGVAVEGAQRRVNRTPSGRISGMSIVVRFNPTTSPTEKYDESLKRLRGRLGRGSQTVYDYHVLSGTRREPCVSARFGTHRERLEAFGERLPCPVLADIGIEFSGEQEMFEVGNVACRNAESRPARRPCASPPLEPETPSRATVMRTLFRSTRSRSRSRPGRDPGGAPGGGAAEREMGRARGGRSRPTWTAAGQREREDQVYKLRPGVVFEARWPR